MNDYLNSIKHHDNEDAWSKNGHEQNYNIVLTLLTEHEGLVRNYLSKPQFTQDDIDQLIVEFYRFDIAKRQMVRSSSGCKYLEQHDYSSTLYRLKERPPSPKERELLSLIDKIIEKSKEEK